MPEVDNLVARLNAWITSRKAAMDAKRKFCQQELAAGRIDAHDFAVMVRATVIEDNALDQFRVCVRRSASKTG